MAYDGSRRLRKKDTPEGVLTYSYNGRGQVERLKAFHRVAVSANAEVGSAVAEVDLEYGYDALGRLKTTRNWKVGGGNVSTNFYDGAGLLVEASMPNHVRQRYEHNERNQLTRAVVEKVSGGQATAHRTYDYTLNGSGLRTKVVETPASGAARTVQYEYDNGHPRPVRGYVNGVEQAPRLPRLNRLTRETIGTQETDPHIDYRLDPVGNRLGRKKTGTINNITDQEFGYDANEQFVGVGEPPAVPASFDASGNTISSSGGAITDYYDAENRLIKRTGPNGLVITLGYNAEGHRVWKHVNNNGSHKTLYYLVDERNPTGYAQVLLETQDLSAGPTPSGAAFYEAYEYGQRLISLRHFSNNGNNNFYFGHDGQGSVRMALTGPGDIYSGYTYDYDGYGNLLNSPSTTIDFRYRYTGEQWDPNLELYYLRGRYYAPQLGRFWNRDTFEGRPEEPGSLHKYLYCAADPVNRIDPSGNESLISVMGAAGIGNSLQAMYNGVVSATGNAMQSTLFGIQAGHSANDILSDFILGETGLDLFVDGYNAMRNVFQDPQEAEVAAYMAWEEQLIATVLAAMEDNEFGEITLEIVPQCFVAGTPIATEGGLKPIEQIRVGDKVWAWNESTDQVTLRPVVNRFIHKRSEVFEIQAGRDVLKVTGEHPFFISGKGWTATRDIKAGDFFVTQDDDSLVIDRVDRQQGEFLVYNFEVSTDHNYYVGEEAVLTHNANALRKAMRLNNPLLAAHHIVALRAKGAAFARTLLSAPGTGIVNLNDIRNGVPLPRNLKVKKPPGFARATVHSLVHTDKYYRELERRLNAVAPGKRIQVLRKAAHELRIGKFPY